MIFFVKRLFKSRAFVKALTISIIIAFGSYLLGFSINPIAQQLPITATPVFSQVTYSYSTVLTPDWLGMLYWLGEIAFIVFLCILIDRMIKHVRPLQYLVIGITLMIEALLFTFIIPWQIEYISPVAFLLLFFTIYGWSAIIKSR